MIRKPFALFKNKSFAINTTNFLYEMLVFEKTFVIKMCMLRPITFGTLRQLSWENGHSSKSLKHL